MAAGVPTPPTRVFDPWAFPPPVVVKPRDGVGATDTYLLTDRGAMDHFPANFKAIVQPYCPALPMSMAFLIGPQSVVELLPCEQSIEIESGKMRYRGGRVSHGLENRVADIARQAIAVVTGLFGYVGVDVILRNNEPDLAIEINPRLTTSYIGLRQVCQQNIMELLLRIVCGEIVNPTWNAAEAAWNV